MNDLTLHPSFLDMLQHSLHTWQVQVSCVSAFGRWQCVFGASSLLRHQESRQLLRPWIHVYDHCWCFMSLRNGDYHTKSFAVLCSFTRHCHQQRRQTDGYDLRSLNSLYTAFIYHMYLCRRQNSSIVRALSQHVYIYVAITVDLRTRQCALIMYHN